MGAITWLLPLLLMGGLQTTAPAVEPGFTSLFNGRDFTGWKIAGPADTFTIEDGAIVARGAASHCCYDGSFRNHAFRNFELKVDVMTRHDGIPVPGVHALFGENDTETRSVMAQSIVTVVEGG